MRSGTATRATANRSGRELGVYRFDNMRRRPGLDLPGYDWRSRDVGRGEFRLR